MGAALKLVRGEGIQADAFAPARVHFEGLITTLAGKGASAMNHLELEDYLVAQGRELMRELLQSHLTLRGERRVDGNVVVGADGIERSEVREKERDLNTVLGTVKVTRVGHGKRGNTSVFPLDAELNLPKKRHSQGLQRIVAEESTRGSFDEVVAAVSRHTGGTVSKRQAEEMTVAAACDFEHFYAERTRVARGSRHRSGALMVLSFDGVGVRVYPEDLREPRKKRKARTGSKLLSRIAPGEKPGLKRMATVAAVYTLKPHARTGADLLKGGRITEAPKRPAPEQKRVWASLTDDVEKVVADAFREALMRDPKRKKKWVVLVDGNEHQIAVIKEVAVAANVEVTIVLDILHVAEYVWSAAHAFHPDDEEQRTQWVTDRLFGILDGNSSNVAAGIRRSATRRELDVQQRKAADACADYLLKYASYLRYSEYLAAGTPIGTGVVEGAGRYLVKDRMDISGARWHLESAEAVLRLRAMRASGDFQAYWAFHVDAEWERNHAAKYKNGVPPLLQEPPRRRRLKVVK